MFSKTKISRRQSLAVLTYAAAFGPLALEGCGGGGSRSSSGGNLPDLVPDITSGPITGKIALPTVPLAPSATYRILTGVNFAPVNADGSFTVNGFTNAPALAYILNVTTGQTAGMAYIAPNDARIDAMQMARTLAYLSMKGPVLPSAASVALWNALKTQPEVVALAADIQKLTGTLDANSVVIKASVTRNIGALLQRVKGNSAASRQAALKAPRGAVRSVTISNPPTSQTRQVRIAPADGASYVMVTEQGQNDIVIVNYVRRRAWAYVDRIQSTRLDGTHEQHESLGNFSVDAVTGVPSLSSGIADAGTILGDQAFSGYNVPFTGNVAGTPTRTAPVNVSVFPSDAISTQYRVMVVGPGRTKNAPKDVTPAMQAKQTELVNTTLLFDIAIPTFLALLGPITERFTEHEPNKEDLRAAFSGMKDFLAVIAASPAIQAKFDNDDFIGGVTDVETALFNSDAGQKVLGEAVKLVIGALNKKVPTSQRISDVAGYFEEFKSGFGSLLGKVDILLQGADDSFIVGFWSTSNAYERFILDVDKGTVHLTPKTGVLSVLGSLNLTASVPSTSGSIPSPSGSDSLLVTYKWTLLSGTGVQLTNGINTGASFTSSKGTVTVQSTTHDTGTAQVQVEAILKNLGSAPDQSLGTAVATLKIVNDKAMISPADTSIVPGGHETFVVTIKDAQSGSRYLYKWSTSGAAGKLNVDSELTGRGAVDYTAGSANGSDTVTVDVYENGTSGPVHIGSASATVTVSDQPTVVPGTFKAIVNTVGEREYVSAVVTFSPVPGAKSYTLHGTGSNDPYYYGNEITITVNAPAQATLYDNTVLDNAFGLAGGGGPIGSGFAAYYNSRFGGFKFTVTANR
jgi:hypothetical protein